MATIIEYHPQYRGLITNIRCGCGTKIAGLVPTEETLSSKMDKHGRLVQERLVVFAHLAPYRQITLKMNDGGEHVTSMCQSCADALTLAQAVEHYKQDLEHMVENSKRVGDRTPLSSVIVHRVPVEIVR